MNNFYENGLNFSCIHYSKCFPETLNIVLLGENNIVNLSKILELIAESFVKIHCKELKYKDKVVFSLIGKMKLTSVRTSTRGRNFI